MALSEDGRDMREADLERNFRKLVRIVGENQLGRYSSIWSFKGGNDGFYFGARSIFNRFKVSLHANNHRGYIAQSKSFKDGIVRPRQGLLEWALPSPGLLGAVQAASIKLPANFMFDAEPPYVRQRKTLVFGIQPECALEVGIFLSNEGKDTLEEKFCRMGHPLFQVTISGWLNVSIVVRSVDFDASCLPNQEQMDAARYTPIDDQLSETSNLGMICFNKPGDGETIQLIDIGGVSMRRSEPENS
jgi:hypothetical protein